MALAVTQSVGMPVIDQEHRAPIGHDLHYVIKFSFFPRCHTNERNVPFARKSGQRGMAVVRLEPRSDEIKEFHTSRVPDQAPSQTSRNLREEAVPKSIARVLNASRIRSEWKQSLGKRKPRGEEQGAEADSQHRPRKKSKTKGSGAEAVSEDTKLPLMRIQPGESLAHFNKLSVCN